MHWEQIRNKTGLKYIEPIFTLLVILVSIFFVLIRKNERVGKRKLFYGAYGNRSVGDDAINYSIANGFINDIDNVVFSSYDVEYSKRKIGNEFTFIKQGRTSDGLYHLIKERNKFDIFVYGGGGVFETHSNDLRSTIGMLYKLSKLYLVYALGKNIVYFSVGANSNDFNILIETLIKHISKKCLLITTRDMVTFEKFKKCNNNVHSLCDIANSIQIEKKKRKRRELSIGINLMPFGLLSHRLSQQNKILELIAKDLSVIDVRIKNIYLFPMVINTDEDISKELVKKFRNYNKTRDLEIINPNISVSEMIDKMSELDIFIGMRLHANIMAIDANTPIIGIGYHSKVERLYKQYDLDFFYIDIYKYNKGWLNDRVTNLINNFDLISEEILQKRNNKIREANKHFELITEVTN